MFANTCIFSKLKSYLVLTGAQCSYRQACADLPNEITYQNNIIFYLMIWYRNWKNIVHQNMDTPEENSVTQINKDKTLTARILSQSVCFSICYVHDKYILWFYEFMINCCFFSVMKNPGLFSYDVWKSKRNSSKSAKYTYQSFITKYYSGMSFISSLKVTYYVL